ncbi:hypothetical protein [Lactiplantibacillus plantarum]|uniref:hypothetical protein n=1 Tax=Lactiplantibacillus plantarum TaxID=1590 RepID=UPI0028FC0D0C|nr:hypothetical protein [Lactiplantibacillus plantarum]WNW15420.1 hypothetical protein RUO99_12885 [Lactiplantibacillus plantarum]WNW18394.1 hypothetical protein RUP00_12875 [Lactiplantibacillus plantarum]
MLDNLLNIDEKVMRYIKEKICSLQHVFLDKSESGVMDSDILHKVLVIFMDMQDSSKSWTMVTKQELVNFIKEKSSVNKLPDEVDEVLQQFADYLKKDIEKDSIPESAELKRDSENLYYTMLSMDDEIQSQKGELKNKAEFFDFIKEFNSETEFFVGLTTKKMYDLSTKGVKGSKHEKTMKKSSQLNVFKQTYLAIMFAMQGTDYQKYLNKTKKEIITNPNMLDELVKNLHKLANTSKKIGSKSVGLLPMQMKSPEITQVMFESTYHIALIKLACSILSDFKAKLVARVKVLLEVDPLEAILILENLRKDMSEFFTFNTIIQTKIYSEVNELVKSDGVPKMLESVLKDTEVIRKHALDSEVKKVRKYENMVLKTEKVKNFDYDKDDFSTIMFGIYGHTSGNESSKL